MRWSGNRSRDELLTDIGLGSKIATIVAKRLAHLLAEHGTRPDALTLTLGRYASDDAAPSQGDGADRRQRRRLGAARHLLPADPRRRDRRLPRPRRRPAGAHRRMHASASACASKDSERWMRVEWAEEPTRAVRDRGLRVLVTQRQGRAGAGGRGGQPAPRPTSRTSTWAKTAPAETTELRLLITVRDRLHLADVLRTIRRCPPVLRVWRVKP